MRQRDSTSVKNSQSASALIALVRLLARQAAAEFAARAPAQREASTDQPEERE
jgi:hypothetical protein